MTIILALLAPVLLVIGALMVYDWYNDVHEEDE